MQFVRDEILIYRICSIGQPSNCLPLHRYILHLLWISVFVSGSANACHARETRAQNPGEEFLSQTRNGNSKCNFLKRIAVDGLVFTAEIPAKRQNIYDGSHNRTTATLSVSCDHWAPHWLWIERNFHSIESFRNSCLWHFDYTQINILRFQWNRQTFSPRTMPVCALYRMAAARILVVMSSCPLPSFSNEMNLCERGTALEPLKLYSSWRATAFVSF